MLAKTLTSAEHEIGATPLKVVRLRYYAGMSQGVVVTGGGDESQQLVFNASTGASVSSYEKGYPETPFPFGWHYHELAKRIHRGDFFGMTGRLMDLFAGLSLIYLVTSGMFIYTRIWRQRLKIGLPALFWK
jgi:uncharacterized iron-regulated membrane protein